MNMIAPTYYLRKAMKAEKVSDAMDNIFYFWVQTSKETFNVLTKYSNAWTTFYRSNLDLVNKV